MEGFATLLGGGLAGLAGANAQGGATAAQNEVLNNTDKHPEDAAKNGGVLSAFGNLVSAVGDQLASAGRGAVNMGNQFLGLMNANSGQTPPSDPNPLVQANDGNPPNTGASPVTPSTPATPVCDPPVCTVMPGSPGTSGHITISNGNSGDDSGTGTGMLGENGPQFASKTIWKGDGQERIDVENPNPGQRPGQIHYQDNNGNKYLYDPSTNSFPGAPNSVNKLLSNQSFSAAIQKGLTKYLGGN